MGEYSKFISKKRRSVPTPEGLVDKNGKFVFGTFDKEFETMEMLKAKHPTLAPDAFKKLKLTLWEASEVNLKDGVLLAVVCDMGIFGLTMNVFYDKRNHNVYSWQTQLKSKDTEIASNLMYGNESKAETPFSHVRYVNTLDQNKATLDGHHEGVCPEDGKEHKISYEFEYERISKPCCVSIPFPYYVNKDYTERKPKKDANRSLYSQKDFFKCTGKLVFDGEEFPCDENTTSIIDDHRGYYPRKAHYDWCSTMGRSVNNGEQKYFAFNLTWNQSCNPEDYNENIIWTEGATSLLPPIKFSRNILTKDHKTDKDGVIWTIKDEHDMVNVKFHVFNKFSMLTHACVVVIDYYVVFGELEGYMRDEDGNKYILDGLMGIGEDKTLLL